MPAVEISDLVVRYDATVAVAGLSMTADGGEVVALLGPNGAGKTSTVEAAEGYRAIDGGAVRVLGADPVRDRKAVVPRIGVMLQQGGVYPTMTPRQALRLFASYYDEGRAEDPEALLDLVRLQDVAATAWRKLSGGEQQRLSLALALVGRPDVAFLDEPTAGVDPEGRLAIRSIVRSLRDRGCCVVLATHELAEAEQLADRVVVVAGGRVRAEGTVAEIVGGVGGDVGSVRFRSSPGLDTGSLAAVAGAPVSEERPGHYAVAAPSTPSLVAAVAGWLGERGAPMDDVRSGGRSLEDAYLAIVGADAGADDAAGPSSDARPARRRGRRR